MAHAPSAPTWELRPPYATKAFHRATWTRPIFILAARHRTSSQRGWITCAVAVAKTIRRRARGWPTVMAMLDPGQLDEFAERGFLMLPRAVPPDVVTAAAAAIDELIERDPPGPQVRGPRNYFPEAAARALPARPQHRRQYRAGGAARRLLPDQAGRP